MAEYLLTSDGFAVGLKIFLNATSINIADAGSFYTGTEVETALQEVGAELKVHNLNGWEDASKVALSWDNTDKEVTLTFTDTVYYWSDGIRYSQSGTDTLAIGSDTSGVWWFWYDGDTLVTARNPTHQELDDIIWNKCLVFAVCWNANDSDTVLLASELHGCQMSGKTHEWIHDAIGATFREGGGLSEYELATSSDAAISFDLTDVEYYDEDIEHEINDAADASGQYEQVLTGQAEIPVLFRDATDGSWSRQAASVLPYISPGGVPKFMRDDGATWSQQNLGNAKYMLYFLYATNDWEFPIQMVQGSASYVTKAAALDGVNDEIVNWGELPSAEFLLLYVFVVREISGGTANLQIVEITDYRTTQTSGGIANPATDHGGLTGLGDVGDHLGYVLLDGTRPLTADWDAGAFTIKTDTIQATDAGGIALLDDGGNLGLTVADGGAISITQALTIKDGGSDRILLGPAPGGSTYAILGNLALSQSAFANYAIMQGQDGTTYINASSGKTVFLRIANASKVTVTSALVMLNAPLFIWETVNTKMTTGITINQTSSDDEILAFKSSDVSHGMSTDTEVDTFGSFKKTQGAYGGLDITGYTERQYAIRLVAQAGTGVALDTTKSSAARGVVEIQAELRSNGAGGALSADANLLVIRNAGSCSWLVDEDGDTWQAGTVIAKHVSDKEFSSAFATFKLDSSNATGLTWIGNNRFRYYPGSDQFARSAVDELASMMILNNDVIEFYNQSAATSGTYSLSPSMSIVGYGSGLGYVKVASRLYVNDTGNANMNVGLTINQAGFDDEILAFKSSDVGHGVTTQTETDTYCFFEKASAASGGINIKAFGATSVQSFGAYCSGFRTAKTTGEWGSFNFSAYGISGTGVDNVTANANIFTIAARVGGSTLTRWILDEDGDTWQSGDVSIVATKKINLDGVGGHTYISENSSDNLRLVVGGTVALTLKNTYIYTSSTFFVNDTLNAKMTKGITINQAANDDEILAFKSSDINHGRETLTEIDTYGYFTKVSGSYGGLKIAGIVEDSASAPNSMQFLCYGGTANTTKSTAGTGLVTFYIGENSGDAIANITADGNMVAFIGRVGGAWVARWILDEDGDTWQSGVATMPSLMLGTTPLSESDLGELTEAGETELHSHAGGGGGGAPAGNWVLVEEKEVSAEILDWTISDLDGNTDRELLVKFQMVSAPDGGAEFKMQYNGDTGDNYDYQMHWFGQGHSSGGAEGVDYIRLTADGASNWQENGEIRMPLETGTKRFAFCTTMRQQGGGDDYVHFYTGTWQDDSTNITSVRLFTNNAVTAKLRVYKWQEVEDVVETHNCVVFAERDASQSTANGVAEIVEHDVIHVDRGGHYDAVNNRVIATQKGVYRVDANVSFSSISGGWDIFIYKDGAEVATQRNQQPSSGTGSVGCFWIGELEVGEYVEHWIKQYAGTRSTNGDFVGGTVFGVELLYTT